MATATSQVHELFVCTDTNGHPEPHLIKEKNSPVKPTPEMPVLCGAVLRLFTNLISNMSKNFPRCSHSGRCLLPTFLSATLRWDAVMSPCTLTILNQYELPSARIISTCRLQRIGCEPLTSSDAVQRLDRQCLTWSVTLLKMLALKWLASGAN